MHAIRWNSLAVRPISTAPTTTGKVRSRFLRPVRRKAALCHSASVNLAWRRHEWNFLTADSRLPARLFLNIHDHARPRIRLAALMGTGVVYVTPDSSSSAEDGPDAIEPSNISQRCSLFPTCAGIRSLAMRRVAECWSWR